MIIVSCRKYSEQDFVDEIGFFEKKPVSYNALFPCLKLEIMSYFPNRSILRSTNYSNKIL